MAADFTGVSPPTTGGPAGIIGVDDGTGSNRIQSRFYIASGNAGDPATAVQTVTSASANLVNSNGGAARNYGLQTRQALRVSANGAVTTARDGVIVRPNSGALATPVGLSRFSLGSLPGSQALNGYLRRAQLIPGDMTDAQLQAVTA